MSNTEGSQVKWYAIRLRTGSKIILSHKQRQVIIGSVLGDAYIHPRGKICIEQGEHQLDYLSWKKYLLGKICYSKISRVRRFDLRNKRNTVSYRFFLRQYFRSLRKMFYPNEKKTIPTCLESEFDAQALAIWYMDDGYLERKYPQLMTESYSDKDCQRLVGLLFRKFGIRTFVTKKGRIRIRGESVKRFISIIRPYMHESMYYKITLP